jgi:hypothetical protein
MQVIFGTLAINGLASMLRPQNALLLMSGFPDAQQASRAATNFIVNIKGLRSGTAVAVTGTSTSVGNQPAIVMTDINAAGGLEKHAPEALVASPKRTRKVRKKKK